MFTGIVEAKSRLLNFRADDPTHPKTAQIEIEKPNQFDDLKLGDSVCVDGVCLTVEKLSDSAIYFSLGYETLKVTNWGQKDVGQRTLNLERSMRYNDRIHGHIVTGHVDGTAQLVKMDKVTDNWGLEFRVDQDQLLPMIWRKGSVAINGVSLTVNEVKDDHFSVCIIPETIKRTNLADLSLGQTVNIEVDQMARGLAHLFSLERSSREFNL